MNSLDKVLEKEFLKKEISFEKDISSIINRIRLMTKVGVKRKTLTFFHA